MVTVALLPNQTYNTHFDFATSKRKYRDFPHLFRKLNWWENRTVEQMPKRLICKAAKMDKTIHEIESWDMEELFGWTDKRNRVGCGLTSFNPEYGYFPVD